MKKAFRYICAVLILVLLSYPLSLPVSAAEESPPDSEPEMSAAAENEAGSETETSDPPTTFTPYALTNGIVEKYAPTIRFYTGRLSIGGYSELVKALMMQESGGRGTDPMQASESGYNVAYPSQPNGIADPEYSIEVGTYAFYRNLCMAGAGGPADYAGIALALQGYNYGSGYILWALENYGGYSKLNAIEYSERMCEKLGYTYYGDRNYVAHVLRYYHFPGEYADTPEQLILAVAADQLGGARWAASMEEAGLSPETEISALFVSWCLEKCGCLFLGTMPAFRAAETACDWLKSRGGWMEADASPRPGDLLFLDGDGDGRADHTAIVDGVENDVIHTIEADAATLVCVANQYETGRAPVVGYGRPIY